MPRLADVCRYVRSKNAGPFWLTIDLFFDGEDSYALYRGHPAIGADTIARLYGVPADDVKRFAVDDLRVIKLSFPRPVPQGGAAERDMHGGQFYARLLDLWLD
jgi:hypothetical protein